MKRLFTVFIAIVLICFSFVNFAYAQTNDLIIKFSRDFGYSGIGSNEIQGLFSITASSSYELSKVTYFIDGNVMGEAAIEPKDVPINTQAIVSWFDKEVNCQENIPIISSDKIEKLVEIVKLRSVDISVIE